MVSFACGLVSLCQVTSHVLRIADEAHLIVRFQDDPRQALKLRVQARFDACQANMLCAEEARLIQQVGQQVKGEVTVFFGITALYDRTMVANEPATGLPNCSVVVRGMACCQGTACCAPTTTVSLITFLETLNHFYSCSGYMARRIWPDKKLLFYPNSQRCNSNFRSLANIYPNTDTDHHADPETPTDQDADPNRDPDAGAYCQGYPITGRKNNI